jgi:hypothetical protein
MEKRIYNIHRVRFYQTELNYTEHLQVLTLVKEDFAQLSIKEVTLEQLIDKLFLNGTLERLFKIVVKRYEPNVFVKWWNMFWVKVKKVDVTNPITGMTSTQIAKVLSDFFFFYNNWMSGLSSFNQFLGAVSTREMNSLVEN